LRAFFIAVGDGGDHEMKKMKRIVLSESAAAVADHKDALAAQLEILA